MCLRENCNLVKLSSLIVMWFVGVYCIHIKLWFGELILNNKQFEGKILCTESATYRPLKEGKSL